MSPRISAKLDDPILFAHRGGAAHAPENTLEAFALGRKLGATGVESDVWASGDGHAVLVHDDVFGPKFRRRRISATTVDLLPAHVPRLVDLFDEIGTDFPVSLDIKTTGAIDATVNTLREVRERTGVDVVATTWLCHPDLEVLTAWRRRWSDVRLVHSTRLKRLDAGPERHGATLFERNIDAVNFRHDDWSGGLTALYHRFGLYCFGWHAHLQRIAVELLDMGCDAIFGDYVDRLLAARAQVYGY